MTKLTKKPHEFGSAFAAIGELDEAMDGLDQVMSAKIDAVSDMIVGAVKRIEALETPKPARRKKTQAKDAKKQGDDTT